MRNKWLAAFVLVLLSCPPVLAQTQPSTAPYRPRELPPSMRDLYQEAMARGDWAKTQAYLKKWLEAVPTDADGWFSLACAEAQLGNSDAALVALETAVDAGFS